MLAIITDKVEIQYKASMQFIANSQFLSAETNSNGKKILTISWGSKTTTL